MIPVEAAGVAVASAVAVLLDAELVLPADPAAVPALAAEDPVGTVVLGLDGGAVVDVVVVVDPEAPKAKFGVASALTTPSAAMKTSSGTDTASLARIRRARRDASLIDLLPLLLAVVLRGMARSFVR